MRLLEDLEERLGEITAYLDLLDNVQAAAQEGAPVISAGSSGAHITTVQQRMLYSSVYLQLYNLVESAITKCVLEVVRATVDGGRWRAQDLSTDVRREWVRAMTRTHDGAAADERLRLVGLLCDQIIGGSPIAEFDIAKGGGGNWDDVRIEKFANLRLGLKLVFPDDIRVRVKRPIRDDKGALVLVRSLRNDLAHGNISFAECGANVTPSELRELAERVGAYLREVAMQFSRFIDDHAFLAEASRPVPA